MLLPSRKKNRGVIRIFFYKESGEDSEGGERGSLAVLAALFVNFFLLGISKDEPAPLGYKEPLARYQNREQLQELVLCCSPCVKRIAGSSRIFVQREQRGQRGGRDRPPRCSLCEFPPTGDACCASCAHVILKRNQGVGICPPVATRLSLTEAL